MLLLKWKPPDDMFAKIKRHWFWCEKGAKSISGQAECNPQDFGRSKAALKKLFVFRSKVVRLDFRGYSVNTIIHVVYSIDHKNSGWNIHKWCMYEDYKQEPSCLLSNSLKLPVPSILQLRPIRQLGLHWKFLWCKPIIYFGSWHCKTWFAAYLDFAANEEVEKYINCFNPQKDWTVFWCPP